MRGLTHGWMQLTCFSQKLGKLFFDVWGRKGGARLPRCPPLAVRLGVGGGVGGLCGGGRGLRVKQLFQGSFANVGGIFLEGGAGC